VYSSVVERCPDKTEALGPIPSTRTMERFEGFPQAPKNYELTPETMQKIKGFNEAAKVWSALEKGTLVAIPKDPSLYEEIISSLEFLKEKHARPYSEEEQKIQFEKVDAYIQKLKREGEEDHRAAA
jgi:hypothetical protein